MDGPPPRSSKGRLLLAGIVLSVPIALPLSCVAMERLWNPEITSWYRATDSIYTEAMASSLDGIGIDRIDRFEIEAARLQQQIEKLKAGEDTSPTTEPLHLRQIDQSVRPPLEEMDLVVFYLLTSHLSYSKFSQGVVSAPMVLFGRTFAASPLNLYTLHKGEDYLNTYLSFRKQLLTHPQSEILKVLRNSNHPKDSVLPLLSHKVYGYELRPLLRTTAVLAAAREYQTLNGEWPEPMSRLQSRLWFEGEYSLRLIGETLEVKSIATGETWVLK